MKNKFIFIIILLATFMFLAYIRFEQVGERRHIPEKPTQVISKLSLENVSLNDIHGKPIQFTDSSTKAYIINFWATWCPSCKQEIPHLEKIYQNYGKLGVKVIGISFDKEPSQVASFYEKYTLSYPVAMANDDVKSRFDKVYGIPTTVILDKNYEVIDTHVGYNTYEYFESMIKPLIQE